MDVPVTMMKTPGDYFALKVEGDSMIEEGIFDGDFFSRFITKSSHDGDLVVASIDDGATVKRFFHKKIRKFTLLKNLLNFALQIQVPNLDVVPTTTSWAEGPVKALFENIKTEIWSYRATWVPTSTTRSLGNWKYWVAGISFFCLDSKYFFTP